MMPHLKPAAQQGVNVTTTVNRERSDQKANVKGMGGDEHRAQLRHRLVPLGIGKAQLPWREDERQEATDSAGRGHHP